MLWRPRCGVVASAAHAAARLAILHMNIEFIERRVSELAAADGVLAVALVESSSGLVWHASGRETIAASLWEASIDYWRLYQRNQAHFGSLGELGAAVMHHHGGMLAMLPCDADADLFVVCLARHQSVNWLHWQAEVRAFGSQLSNL
jgi:hypothetical protein